MNVLFFDTETTGKYDFQLPSNHPTQPYLVQLACILTEEQPSGDQIERSSCNLIIKPDGWSIPQEVAEIHGITDDIANRNGVNLKSAAFLFNNLCYQADLLVAHNIDFDKGIMSSVFSRLEIGHRLSKINRYCTMRSATPVVKLQRANSSANSHNYKWPTLTECMKFFFDEDFSSHAHDALNDVTACARVFWELRHRGY